MNNLYTYIPSQVVMRTMQHCSDRSVPTNVFRDASILAESDWEDLKAKFRAS